MNVELSERLDGLVSPKGICGGYAYKLIQRHNPRALTLLLNDRILVSALDG